MDNYGKLLFQSKNDELKKGLSFLILGVLILVGANFVYAKVVLYLLGIVFILAGLYFVLFKRKDEIKIFEKAIVFSNKEKHVVKKNDISSIEYKEVSVRRNPIASYYPLLILKDGSVVQMNIFFNNLINQELKTIMDEFLPN
jgi:cadmium resistance protein CadD (predicted permease)